MVYEPFIDRKVKAVLVSIMMNLIQTVACQHTLLRIQCFPLSLQCQLYFRWTRHFLRQILSPTKSSCHILWTSLHPAILLIPSQPVPSPP